GGHSNGRRAALTVPAPAHMKRRGSRTDASSVAYRARRRPDLNCIVFLPPSLGTGDPERDALMLTSAAPLRRGNWGFSCAMRHSIWPRLRQLVVFSRP